MVENSIEFDSVNEQLKVIIKKDSEFNFLHIVTIILTLIGLVIFALFTLNSILNDGIIGIRIIFVILGLLTLRSLTNHLKNTILLIKGEEEIIINNTSFYYTVSWGPIKKSVCYKINKIKIFELHTIGMDMLTQSSNVFFQIKYGMIGLGKSKKRSISFGQSLEKEEIVRLYNELKIYIPQSIK